MLHPMKRLLFFVCLAFFATNSLPAADALINASARQTLSLNGRWHVIVDPYDNGYFNYRLEPYDAAANPTRRLLSRPQAGDDRAS